MHENLFQKFHSLHQRRKRLCERSEKIRSIEIRRKIVCEALKAFPHPSAASSQLHEIELELNQEDVLLRPWKAKKLNTDKKISAQSPMESVHKSNMPTSSLDTLSKSDFFKNPHQIHVDSFRKGSLEWQLDHSLHLGQIDYAIECSDRISERDALKNIDGKVNQRNSELNSKQQNTSHKQDRPVWLFQSKEKWETKSNM